MSTTYDPGNGIEIRNTEGPGYHDGKKVKSIDDTLEYCDFPIPTDGYDVMQAPAVILGNGVLQWGRGRSTKSNAQNFDLAIPVLVTSSVPTAVTVTRWSSGSTDLLPVTRVEAETYTIDRSSDISGKQQDFSWISMGPYTTQTVNSGHTAIGDGMIQWGMASSASDGLESFSFPVAFETVCQAVLTTRTRADTKNNLPVVGVSTTGFKVNRNDEIDGRQPFFWIALGDCPSSSSSSFSVPTPNGYIVKGGYALSTKNNDEKFTFDNAFTESCMSVVTTRTGTNTKDSLPVVSMNKGNFVIDRNDSIDGKQGFYWVAIGR